jgi:hypothetical protein
MGHDLAMTTERHLPLDGGGWEGVGPLVLGRQERATNKKPGLRPGL